MEIAIKSVYGSGDYLADHRKSEGVNSFIKKRRDTYIATREKVQGEDMAQTGKSRGGIIKSVFVMYVLTGLMLVGLSVLVSRVEKEEMVARIGVILVYIISCGIGGMLLGRWQGRHKFAWGLVAGMLYVIILLGIGIAIAKGGLPDVRAAVTTIFICLGAGMLGGMLS